MKRAVIEIETKNPELITDALKPELKEDFQRTKIDIIPGDKKIKLMIDAEDVSALRAALNSYLRWINLAMEINDEI